MDPQKPEKPKTSELRTAVDTLYLYDPQFEPAANRFLREVGGSTAIHPVKSWEDVKAAANNYSLVKLKSPGAYRTTTP